MVNYSKILGFLLPDREVFQNKIPWYQAVGVFLVFFLTFYVASKILFADGYRGFDWKYFWRIHRVPPFYPPWTKFVIFPLNWHALVALTLAATLLASLLRLTHPISAIMAFFTLPLWWAIYLGQLEGFAVLGLIWLPWLAPLALVKPQISFFALWAKKSYLVGLVVFLLLTIIVWGFWPLRTLAATAIYANGKYPQDISIGLRGLIVALPLFWFSRGDMDMLMVAGAFTTTHLIPYNLLPIIPSIARLKPVPAAIAAILSWLPLSANWLGPKGWWLGWFFIGWLWVMLALERYPQFTGFLKRS